MRCSVRVAVVTAVVLTALLVPAAVVAAPGDHLWGGNVFNVNGAGDESAVAVATDGAGNATVVGNAVTSAAGDFDIRYCSYDVFGIWRWTSVETLWDNPGNPGADDTAAGVVVDDARDCVYVAGTTTGATGDRDIALLKVADGVPGYLPGELIWAKTPGTPVGKDDEAEAVALDKYGNAYVTGGAQRADGSMDVYTMKFRPNGSLTWWRSHNNAGSRFDRGLAVAVRGTAVYVAGVSNRAGHGDDLVLIKYSLGGTMKWVRYYDDALHRHESLSGIATTSDAVYLCGSGRATATKPGDALLVKFRSDGTRAWVAWAAGPAGLDDAWTDVAVDARARAHVTGYHTRSATGEDVVTAMYTTGGARSWQRGYSTTGRRMDVGTALAVEPTGHAYVCGLRTGADGDADIVVLKYGVTGATLWKTVYPDPLGYPFETDLGDDWAVDVALGGPAACIAGRVVADHSGVVDADFLALGIER